MTQVHSSTKPCTFTHLTEAGRGQFAAYLEEELSIKEIAGEVQVLSFERNKWGPDVVGVYKNTWIILPMI